jgi:diguanylate cyclase (GGDEF)-like protein
LFSQYKAPASQPESAAWAHSLFVAHGVTAIVTLILASVVYRLLNSGRLGTKRAISLQVSLCLVYLLHGATISYIDLSVGAGITSFTLICVGVGGLSLMRPAISAPLYIGAFAIFWELLRHLDLSATLVTSMRINAFAAVILAFMVSTVIWYQYAGGAALRRQLRDSNDELTDAQRDLQNLVGIDPLTGLPNRRLLLDRLKQALVASARSGHAGGLVFLDLDNFKALNDTRGHDMGDLLLQQVGQRLRSSIREGDTVARLGGDEFVLVLCELSSNPNEAAMQAENVGEKVRGALNQEYLLSGYLHHCTPSIGITLFSGNQLTPEELMKRADVAMYQAKTAGRNNIQFFDPEMQRAVTARVALEGELRQALADQQFHLHYQPQVDAHGQVTGAEALVRWQHPQRGMVSPAEFIPLAEETGLILPLGHWVLEAACTQLAAWAKQPALANLIVAVNVSALQMALPDFVELVLAVLERTGARPDRLKLELTEGLMLKNAEQAITKMTALRARNVTFSLDDFGTGYSSLSYLKRLPLDQLKIDQSFVSDLLVDPNDAAIARTVIALGDSLGLAVIAEGVETEAQRELLAQHGCLAYQGYLFSRPLSADAFEAFVAANVLASR